MTKTNQKIQLLAILITLLVATSCSLLIDKIGGDFKGDPVELNSKISDGAKLLIKKAFKDVRGKTLHDYHNHIVGLHEHEGTQVNPKKLTWWKPINRLKTAVYMSGSKVDDLSKVNEQYIARFVDLVKNIENPGKFHLLAFDHHYEKDGSINNERSEFYVSNEYIFKTAEKFPEVFVPVISVHPYRKDALQELEKFAKKGAKLIKWLPNAQGMKASDRDIDEYYKMVKKYDMAILTHTGEEHAVDADEDQALGNPLLFRRPLDMGVKIIMAHCASRGEDEDFDNQSSKKPSFDLFMRMMDNPKYEGLLFGEISVTTQFNRIGVLDTLLKRKDLHHRLLNGSDYPLPAINVIIHTKALHKAGYITEEEREQLNEVYNYNPLLFDYVVKRTIKHPITKDTFDIKLFLGLEDKLRKLQ